MFNGDKVDVEVEEVTVDSNIEEDPDVKEVVNKYLGKDNISTSSRSSQTSPFFHVKYNQ